MLVDVLSFLVLLLVIVIELVWVPLCDIEPVLIEASVVGALVAVAVCVEPLEIVTCPE